MTGPEFMAYLHAKVIQAYPTALASDPVIELYDGRTRITDRRGGELKLYDQPTRVLRQLAYQLELVADELERRGYEQ